MRKSHIDGTHGSAQVREQNQKYPCSQMPHVKSWWKMKRLVTNRMVLHSLGCICFRLADQIELSISHSFAVHSAPYIKDSLSAATKAVQQPPCKLGSRWCDLAVVNRQDPNYASHRRLDFG